MKKLLFLSLLAVPLSLKSTDTPAPQSPYLQYINNPLFRGTAGAAIGCAAGWALKYFGAEKVTTVPGISHLFVIATPEERQYMFDHLELVGALIGLMVAKGKIHRITDLTKAATFCNLMRRITNKDFSPILLARDAALLFGSDAFPEIQKMLPFVSQLKA